MIRGADIGKAMDGRRLEEFFDWFHHFVSLASVELDIKTQTEGIKFSIIEQ